MEPRMDTKEHEEAARYALQCRKASLEELRAMMEEKKGMNKEKLIMNRDEKVEELRVESAALPPVDSAEPREVSERDFGGSGRNVGSPLGGESAGTQLALQDAAEAEARTREERDKLREEVAELRGANAELAAKNVDLREEAEWWRREAKKQEGYADALAKKNAWLTAKVAVADWRGGSGGNAEASL